MFRLPVKFRAAWLVLGAALLGATPKANAQAGASVSVRVSVPASMKSAPFDTDRFLNVPPNFSASVLARVPGARFMAVLPNGDILVSQPGGGKVVLVRPQTGGDPLVSNFVTGLRNPHDIVFRTIGATSYVYLSESHQINRFVYRAGDMVAGARQVVVAGLPDASSPELRGAYGHQLKNIALGPDDKLYVAIASTSNADPADTTSDPVRCAVYQYNADGTNRRLFARGLRNAEGLAFVPGTNELWVTVNNRDNIAYPFHNDFDGDGSDDYGKVMQGYVDNHPPDEFTRVADGANYGWPFANPNPDTPSGMDNPPFDPDVQNNPEGSSFPLSTFTRISKGLQAHSAALGVSFLQNTPVPQAYRNGAVIALHGSWNRTRRIGYKIIFFPWNGASPGAQMDLVTGWLDPATQGVWGRPVDVVPDLGGNLLISDDASGTIYKLSPTTTPATSPAWTGTDIAVGSDNKARLWWNNPDARAQQWTFGSTGAIQNSTNFGPYPGWTSPALAVGSDNKSHMLWTNPDGNTSLWTLGEDSSFQTNFNFGPFPGWTARDIAVGGDGKTCVLWTNTDGTVALWRVGADGKVEINHIVGPFLGWTAKAISLSRDNKMRVLWTHSEGYASFWLLDERMSLQVNPVFGPYAGWTARDIAAANDGQTRVLWTHTDGSIALWNLRADGAYDSSRNYGPYSGWTARSLAVGGDNQMRVLWTHTDGRSAFWTVAPDGQFNFFDVGAPTP